MVTLEAVMLLGLLAIPAWMPVFVGHVKRFARWAARRKRPDASPWPLVTDLACIVAVVVTWRDGLLQHVVVMPDGVPMRFGTVVLLGIVTGVACTTGYDWYWKRREAPPSQ